MIIYSNTLANGWANWGWATINYANTSPVYTGCEYSISVTMSNGWQGIQIVNTEMSDAPYANISFWLNGGTSGGQHLQMYGLEQVGSTQNEDVGVNYSLSTPQANTWLQYTVPLSGIGVSNVANFTGFVIQDSAGTGESTFYLDNIQLNTNNVATSGTNATAYIGIDAGTNRLAISPMIYGVAWAAANDLEAMGCTMNRGGGNAETSYNWQINAHNHASDWYFESLADDPATPGASTDSLVADSKAAGAQALVTIPMIGWAPILGPSRGKLASYSIAKYGPQTGSDSSYMPDAGNGISTSNGISWQNRITWNNPNDANTPVGTNFQMGYVKHLITNWGVSTNGGVGYYIMDNEHSLWSSTHQDVHPVGPTMQEILDDIEAYASMVKSVDSNALVLGPEEWGWPGYLYSGYDQQWSGSNNNYNVSEYPDRQTNGGWDYYPWLLNQLHQYQQTNGQRLLDYCTAHCYPQEGNVSSDDADTATELLRNESTRVFWDTNYVDPSWIDSIIMLIPRMSNWVATYYPGTKIGITEYNWGGETSMNGATAQADILGIFGRQGLNLATRWTVPEMPTYLAFEMYRNYDGNHSTFGDTSVLAGGPDPDNVSVFAAERSSDGALTIMAINKYLNGNTPLALNLTNYTGSGTAQVWQLNNGAISQLSNLPYSSGLLQTTVPPQSVTLLVIPPSPVLTLLAGTRPTNGNFPFWVQGEIGGKFVLQSSTNLFTWTPVSTNTLSGQRMQFLPATNSARIFYRAVSISL